MNERATRMLFAAAALSAFAVLASTANASRVHEQLGEIGAWAVPPNSHQKPQLLQQTSVGEKLGEIGAWAVPSISHQKPQLLQQTSVGEKLGEIGAWAVPSISHQKPQTPLTTHPTIPNVDPSMFDGYRR